jgi:hypothetical protein
MNAPCKLRLVDDRGAERDWAWHSIGYFAFAPRSINNEISAILGHPVYCMGIEKIIMPLGNDVWMNRLFVQTGERDDKYLLTYEIMSPEICQQIKAILQRQITEAQKAEMEREYQRFKEERGIE